MQLPRPLLLLQIHWTDRANRADGTMYNKKTNYQIKCGISNRRGMTIDPYKVLYPAEFIGKAKNNADIAALINLDVVNQFN